MTHWRTLSKSKHLAATDLDGKDMKVKIEKVSAEDVEGENGRKDRCRVATLSANGTQCKKTWVINDTNSKVISKIRGSNHMEDWVGTEVTLYPTTTKMKGEVVDCIRVRVSK